MRTKFFGCPLDLLTMEQTIAKVEEMIATGKPHQHVALNAAKVVDMSDNWELFDAVAGCDIVSADGQSIVLAGRLLGHPPPERVAGIDLMMELVRVSAHKGYRPYFFGGTDEVVLRVVGIFKKKYPLLNIAGYRNGYFKKEDEESIARDIMESSADILFVAMPTPKKEVFLARWLDKMKVPFTMGVGGSFDVVAGKTTRAPVIMQRLCLEWLHRFWLEPRRMWKRSFVKNAIFVKMVLEEFFTKRKPDSS